MRFDSSVNDDIIASPMFILIITVHPMNIMGWVAARKSAPNEIVNGLAYKLAVIADDDQWTSRERAFCRDGLA